MEVRGPGQGVDASRPAEPGTCSNPPVKESGTTYHEGERFEVPGGTDFTVRVKDTVAYLCPYTGEFLGHLDISPDDLVQAKGFLVDRPAAKVCNVRKKGDTAWQPRQLLRSRHRGQTRGLPRRLPTLTTPTQRPPCRRSGVRQSAA